MRVFLTQLMSVLDHRAQLEHREPAATLAGAKLPHERWAIGVELDPDHAQRDHRQREWKHCRSETTISIARLNHS